MSRSRRFRSATRLSVAVLATGGLVLAASAPAFATPTSFTQGDLVIYETLGTSSASTAVSLVDYSTAGVPSGFAVNLPIADSGSTHALTESGSAINDGELSLSADGQSLIATGYDAAPGVASITKALLTPRTVAIVSPTGVVDTSTSLTDAQTEGSSTANNFRSATTAVTGGNIYTGGDGGLGITTDGNNTDTYLNEADTVHEVQVLNGNLYDSIENALPGNINEIGTGGLPTGGSPADTPLITGANVPAKFDPDQFAFANLGTGAGPDTLYVADGAKGSTSGDDNLVWKFSLESGIWTQTGSIAVPQAVGLVASVSNVGGHNVANLYITGATTDTAGNNTLLYGITDSSGFGGTLSGSATTLATAPTGTDFKGLAFAPGTTLPNNGDTPEFAIAVALPALAAVLFGGYVLYRRRYQAA